MRVLCASLLLRMHNLRVECRPGINSLVGSLEVGFDQTSWLELCVAGLGLGGPGEPIQLLGPGRRESPNLASAMQPLFLRFRRCNVVSARFGGFRKMLHLRDGFRSAHYIAKMKYE